MLLGVVLLGRTLEERAKLQASGERGGGRVPWGEGGRAGEPRNLVGSQSQARPRPGSLHAWWRWGWGWVGVGVVGSQGHGAGRRRRWGGSGLGSSGAALACLPPVPATRPVCS